MDQIVSKTFKKIDQLNSPKTSISLLKKKLAGTTRAHRILEKNMNSSEKGFRPIEITNIKTKPKTNQNISKGSLKLISPSSVNSLINIYSSRNETKKTFRGNTIQAGSQNNSAASILGLNVSIKNSVIMSPKHETVFPISPKIALTQFQHELNDFEKGEVLDYPDIYYFGKSNCKITPSKGSKNRGYDDERADYYLVKGDHIAYRYEIKSLLGKGSFGQVCLCYD